MAGDVWAVEARAALERWLREQVPPEPEDEPDHEDHEDHEDDEGDESPTPPRQG